MILLKKELSDGIIIKFISDFSVFLSNTNVCWTQHKLVSLHLSGIILIQFHQ